MAEAFVFDCPSRPQFLPATGDVPQQRAPIASPAAPVGPPRRYDRARLWRKAAGALARVQFVRSASVGAAGRAEATP